LLSKHLLPAIRRIAGDTFVFQQDSAPAHRARDTVALLARAGMPECLKDDSKSQWKNWKFDPLWPKTP